MKHQQISDIFVLDTDKTGWPWSLDITEDIPEKLQKMPGNATWPRITIVTPSYNQGRFIEETIRSVVLQEYPNLEYIIIDGGSTDNTVEIIRKYESRITYWVSEKDRGQTHAVNKGWGMATGEILGWLNSDDFYMPGALHQVALSYQQGGRGMIYGDCQVADASSLIRPGVKCMADYSLIRLLSEYTMPQPAVFVTRDLIDEIGILDERLHYAMDFDYFLRAWMSHSANHFYYTQHILAVSREHPSTKSGTGFTKGTPVFVIENIKVLKTLAKLRSERLCQDATLKDAFAIALIRQARKLAWTGCGLQAFFCALETFLWCPNGLLKYISTRDRGRVRKELLRNRA